MGDWDDIAGRLADADAAGDQTALEHHASQAAEAAALTGDPKDCALLGVAVVAAGWAVEAQASPGATIGLADAALLILRILTAAPADRGPEPLEAAALLGELDSRDAEWRGILARAEQIGEDAAHVAGIARVVLLAHQWCRDAADGRDTAAFSRTVAALQVTGALRDAGLMPR